MCVSDMFVCQDFLIVLANVVISHTNYTIVATTKPQTPRHSSQCSNSGYRTA